MASSPRPVSPEPLFPRLRGGRGLAPGRAAAHRRARLIGAMIEAVRRHGYETVTIAELVALAGVSKSAFYESFESKQACFLASFEEIVEQGAAQVEAAYRGGSGFRGQLLAAARACAELVAAEPGAAALVLVDSLSLGTAAAPQREAAASRFERVLAQSFAQEPGRGEVSELAVRGIVGGAGRVVYRYLRAGHPEGVGEHVEELLEWAVGYQRPGGGHVLPDSLFTAPAPARSGGGEGPEEGEQRVGWEEPPSSPRSRKALTQRERIVRAAARLAARGGYESLSMPAIAAEAGTSNETFYREFADKQEAFLAAFDTLGARALRLAAGTRRARRDWAEGVAAGTCAALSFIAADPLFARLVFFEVSAAGPVGLARVDLITEQFTRFLKSDALPPEVKPVPDVVVEAIGGGIWTILQHEVAHGHTDSVPALAPALVDFILVPFGIDAEAAVGGPGW